jgi:abortive infection bacteriophage resistance protein
MDMAKIAYLKQIKSFDDQISILKSRGMVIKDEARAKQILQNISYYRLSGYWHPLLADKQRHLFKLGQERKEGTCH